MKGFIKAFHTRDPQIIKQYRVGQWFFIALTELFVLPKFQYAGHDDVYAYAKRNGRRFRFTYSTQLEVELAPNVWRKIAQPSKLKWGANPNIVHAVWDAMIDATVHAVTLHNENPYVSGSQQWKNRMKEAESYYDIALHWDAILKSMCEY